MKQFTNTCYIVFASLCILFCKCAYSNKTEERHLSGKKYYFTANPPGTIKIGNNFFYDQTEMSNLSWLEYMFWTSRVFGKSSSEFAASVPEGAVWITKAVFNNKSCFMPYAQYYLRHPAYSNYPVVGVSEQQAIDYSKWRSDRVMEFILITNKKIVWDSAPNRGTYFSIERYFTGKYKNIKPDTNFLYYPDYRLPTINEWKMAVHYEDSINKHVLKDSIGWFWSDIDPFKNDSFGVNAPTIPVWAGCISKKKKPIYNLRGNVGEWTSEYEVSIGGGWIDKKEIILTQDTFHVKTENAWTGFRNVCEWKRWTK